MMRGGSWRRWCRMFYGYWWTIVKSVMTIFMTMTTKEKIEFKNYKFVCIILKFCLIILKPHLSHYIPFIKSAYPVILPRDLNLETGVFERFWGDDDLLWPPPPFQLNVDIFLPNVDDADAREWLPMNVLVSGRSFGAIRST